MPRWKRLMAAIRAVFIDGVFEGISDTERDCSRFSELQCAFAIPVADRKSRGGHWQNELQHIPSRCDRVIGVCDDADDERHEKANEPERASQRVILHWKAARPEGRQKAVNDAD